MKRSITLFCTLLLLIVSAVPAFAGKVLAEIEYFYSDDGTLTGKAFNGKRVNFEYDLRGQLLAVKDAQGKDLERYTYDPAGNRLSKTINGLTTTYTYDKANQLVTSTVNGKTTHYKYDAAGRMIQAGDKKYIYNGQNKVAEVRQNGKTIAKFEYNIDGQIAKAIYGDKVEEFMWDGLALIWRSGVTYINEPYVTGGNPVMAGDDVLFNDMLGNTLAVNGNPVEMTSFGETTDKNAFFTGKPMIDELGYSFLFRDYNPNQGKWTTTDPLGYPDGWNNLAYVNNGVTEAVDLYGAEVLICRAVVDGIVRHQWIEIHRNGQITAAAGFYSSGGNFIYGQGLIKIGIEEGHITDANKDVLAVYRTSAQQEKALMQEIVRTYVPNPPVYSTYPPQYVCFSWTADIAYIIQSAWNLTNDLNNATSAELAKWGNAKVSPNINNINMMPE